MNAYRRCYLAILFIIFSVSHTKNNQLQFITSANAVESAAAMTDSELNFVMGYGAYINKDYGNCADSFFKALNIETPQNHRARFYLAVCQYYLKNNSFAAMNLNLVNKEALNSAELKAAQKLEGHLAGELEKIREPKWLFVPYAGVGNYSSTDPSLASSMFFGSMVESYLPTYSWKASIEQLSIKGKQDSDGYNQTQWLLGGGSFTQSYLEYRGRIFGVSSSNTNYHNILAVTAGASKWILDGTNRISVDGYITNFPNSVFGHMMVNQLTVASSQYITVQPTWTLWGQLSMNYVVPNAAMANATNTILKLSPSYARYMADLVYGEGNMTYSMGLSMGKEIFGIHNDGAILYSGAEEHGLGWNVAVQVFDAKKNSFKVQYSAENYVKGTDTQLMNASVGSFSLLGLYLF
jgi:hypothetical protein